VAARETATPKAQSLLRDELREKEIFQSLKTAQRALSFMAYDLGYIDLEQETLQPIDNPFGSRVLPMS
jgi:hypothetical protein